MKTATPIFIANSLGTVVEVRGGGDDMSGQFFRSIRLNMGDTAVTKPYAQHSWVHTCVDALSSIIKSVPFVIVKEKKNVDGNFRIKTELAKLRSMKLEKRVLVGRKELEERGFEFVEEGQLYDTFNRPNPLMCGSQLWEAYVVFKYLTGSAFFLLEGKDKYINENEWPSEIWPVGGDDIDPEIDNGTIKSWKRKIRSGTVPIELYQALWFYKFNPYDLSRGLSTFEVIKESVGQDYKAAKYNSAFFDNGAEPGGILTVEEFLDSDKQNAILNKFNDRHKGPSKTNKTALLMGGAKYDRNPGTHQDMQFLEGRKYNRDEIFAAFRMPKMLGTIYEDLQLATAKAAIRMFWETVAIPEMHYIEDVITSKLFNNPKIKDGHGNYVMFDVSGVEALREDLELKSTIAVSFSNIGVPLNDINKRLGLGFPEYPWGNTWYKPFTVSPVDEANTSLNTETAPVQDDGSAKGYTNALIVPGRGIDSKKKNAMWNMWIARVFSPIEKPFMAKVKLYWYALRKEQLTLWDEATKMIMRGMPTKEELDNILFNNSEWQGKLKKTSKPFIYMAGDASLKQAADDLGTIAWGLDDPRIAKVLDAKVNLVTGITDTFWNRLKEAMIEGIDKNETVTEISQRIRSEFNNAASSSRTLTIARTETGEAASGVRNIVLKGEGVKKHEWGTSEDEQVRETHVLYGNAGPRKFDFNYLSLSGEAGTLLHPSYIGGPAKEVINCRCLELPVI